MGCSLEKSHTKFVAIEPRRKIYLKRLEKDPAWHSLYEQQLLTLVERGFSSELENGELDKWIDDGKIFYYMTHQMVIKPNNKSIQFVFNSSQKFRGFSLNSSWNIRPDGMTNLHTTLRMLFRDVEAAQGDIAKCFTMRM